MSGKFLTFEGGEGGGKSTQVKLLADALSRQGIVLSLRVNPAARPLLKIFESSWCLAKLIDGHLWPKSC